MTASGTNTGIGSSSKKGAGLIEKLVLPERKDLLMPEDSPSETQSRSSTIAAVRTQLGFFVLTVLVGEAGLFVFAGSAEGVSRTIGVVGMIVLLLAALGAVYYHPSFRGNSDNIRFGRQIQGHWWEKVGHSEGSALCFMSVAPEQLSGNILLEGRAYGTDGVECATWRSEMVRLYPTDRRITYLWRGKHPIPGSAHHDFHGYGTLEFQAIEDDSAKLTQARGDFWDVDQADPRNTVIKPCELRRVTSTADEKIMKSGSSSEKRDLVMQVLKRW